MLSCSVNKQYEEWNIRVTSQEMVRMYKKTCRALEIITVPGRGERASGNSLWSWPTLLRRNGAPTGQSPIQNSPPSTCSLLIRVFITAFGKLLLPRWPRNQQKWSAVYMCVCASVCVCASLDLWLSAFPLLQGNNLPTQVADCIPWWVHIQTSFLLQSKIFVGKQTKHRYEFICFKRVGHNVSGLGFRQNKIQILWWFNFSKILFLRQ